MAQTLQTYSITAPGFYGLNSQDSSLDLASGFALTAINCVIDKYGRIGARKGWSALHALNGTLGTNNIKSIGELVTTTAVSYIIVAGDSGLFRYTGGTLVTLTYGGGGTAPTITDSNWQMVSLNDHLYLFQSGHEPLLFDPAISTTTYRRLTEQSGSAGTPPNANVAISAYGRIWATDSVTNKTTIFWSDLLTGHKWTAGSSGSLNVDQVWPNGGDVIVGLGAHNGFLFIFGKNNILVYSGATAPATMSLSDSVTGIGCIARDSIQNTGTDLIFLSGTGVRSVLRTIQEKSAPFRDLSKNVRDELMVGLSGETLANVKSVYSPIDSFYLVTLPSLGTVYCFDTKQQLQDGSSRVTTWNGITPKSFLYTANKDLLIGKEGYLGEYGTYQDNGVAYRMSYFTNHTDLGTPSVSSALKKLSVVVVGGTNQYVTMKWGYDFKENYYSQSANIPEQSVSYYGIAEYNTPAAQYADGITLQTLVAYPTGAGKVIQTGYEADINGSALSIQKIEIQAKNGKIL
jgi:hypothetical protein